LTSIKKTSRTWVQLNQIEGETFGASAMQKLSVPASILAITAALALPSHANAQGWGGYGPGGYGPGMRNGYGPGMRGGYGPGMMYGPGYGRTMGPWMMGPQGYAGPGNLNLSADDVKNYFDRWIAFQGNTRLKVGDVKEKDADSIVADIVTKENSSLVQRFIIDRHSGFFRPYEG
jgi:hypothetical protein